VTADVTELVAQALGRAGVGVALLDGSLVYRYVNRPLADINGWPVTAHAARTVREVLPPNLAGQVVPLVERVLATGEPMLAIRIEGSTHAAADRAFEVSYLPLRTGDDPMVGVVVLDVTDRERAIRTARRRLRQQAALADLGQLALRETDLDALLTTATELLAGELRAERAGVLEFVPGRGHLVMRAGFGFPPGEVGAMTAAIGPGSQAGFTLQTDGAVLSHDTDREDRFTFTPALRALGVRSAISVPIPGADEPFGVLGVLGSQVGNFDADDAELVRAAAGVLGAAAVRAAQSEEVARLSAQRGRLVAQALDAGDRERRQVADVLHDDVLQHVLFARLELGALDGDPETKARIRGSLDAAIETLRRVVGGLHPVTLAHAGLTAAIESLANEACARAGLRIDVDVVPQAEGRADRLLVSIVRELLTNVVKHAGATRASVRVGVTNGWLSLDVADDGHGLPAGAVDTALTRGNVGLANIRERVLALGGTVETGAGIGRRGLRVAVCLPAP
jgi:signal transduction histidine kinase